MSNFIKETKHPQTGQWEDAEWLDDYFGKHHYGVSFKDGQIFNADLYPLPTRDNTESKEVRSNDGPAIHPNQEEQVRDEITRIHCNIITHWLNKDAPGKPYAEYEAEDKADILKLIQQAETAARLQTLLDVGLEFHMGNDLEKWLARQLKGVSNE